MAHGDRTTNGKAKDLVLHIQHPDGVQFHALCGRTGSIQDDKYFAYYGDEGMCRNCKKKLAKQD